MVEILPKPEYVSWDEIHNVIYKAHENNRKNGVDIQNAHLSGKQLKDSLGDDGMCFVAIDRDKVIATCSAAFRTLNTWYAHRQKFGYGTLDAVLPEYSGRHIFSHLANVREEFINNKDCVGIYMHIAEGNIIRRQIAQKEGFFQVSIGRTTYNPHNYLVYVKWLKKRPYPICYIRLRFFLSWLILKIKLILGVIK